MELPSLSAPVIGSGIFLVPGPIAQKLPTLALVLLVWITGGVLSLFGSLSIGELAANYPGAGGLYIYLRHIYGKPLAFLYGWALLSLIQSGSIATLASGFALYTSKIVTLTPFEFKALPIVAIPLLLHCEPRRHTHGASSAEHRRHQQAHWNRSRLWPADRTRPHQPASHRHARASFASLLVDFGVALIAVLWAYEGWHVVSFTAGEFKSPAHDLPRSLFWGTLIVTVIYLFLNVAYYAVLTPLEVSGSASAASSSIEAAWGQGAMLLVSVVILTSILGALNGMILTAPAFTMPWRKTASSSRSSARSAKDFACRSSRLLFKPSGPPRSRSWALFNSSSTYVIFTAWIFYGLTVAGVILLRRRSIAPLAGFRTPGYPWVPIAFVLAAAGITLSTVLSDPLHAAYGIALVLIGVPLYLLFQRNREKSTAEPNSEQ